MSARALPDLTSVGPDTPLRLSVAARLAFPDGSMTVSGLRRERDKGNLVVERIAGKEYTTLRNIRHMRVKCQEQQRERASGFVQPATTSKAASPMKPSISSETGTGSKAQAAALMNMQRLKELYAPTSKRSTSRPDQAIRLRSR